MKKEWKIYDRLMRLETGLGGTRSLVDASPEWMDSDDYNSSNDNEECEMEEDREFEMLCGLALKGIILARNLRMSCHTSDRTWNMFISEVLNGHPRCCYEMFRLNVPVFRQLCIDLATNYRLQQTRKVSIEESVGIFLMTLAHGCNNRFVKECFNHSGETIHRHFHTVLEAVLKLSADIIKPDVNYNDDVPEYILNKPRYYPMFKMLEDGKIIVCIEMHLKMLGDYLAFLIYEVDYLVKHFCKLIVCLLIYSRVDGYRCIK
ncbi:unnamed protein product [Lactuca saligna]|uniref:DUF8040 domain-containing protein n=1 Tax=Lactuca saligna TaxID=75948 RepID=A0AA35ZVI0_LACSI|nr:unnamed protein product [Lactuca saligna]